MTNTMIYHITEADSWAAAQSAGHYTAASLQTEGFIHCSTAEQVLKVANNYYQGQQGLVLLKIDEGTLTAELKYEDSHQNGELFPHLYGRLNLEAVVAMRPFPCEPDGRFITTPF